MCHALMENTKTQMPTMESRTPQKPVITENSQHFAWAKGRPAKYTPTPKNIIVHDFGLSAGLVISLECTHALVQSCAVFSGKER